MNTSIKRASIPQINQNQKENNPPPQTTTPRKSTLSQKPVLVVQNVGKTKSRKRSNTSSTSRRSSRVSPSPAHQTIVIEGHPELGLNDVMWINPGPGYCSPKDLREMEDNTARVFPRWLS